MNYMVFLLCLIVKANLIRNFKKHINEKKHFLNSKINIKKRNLKINSVDNLLNILDLFNKNFKEKILGNSKIEGKLLENLTKNYEKYLIIVNNKQLKKRISKEWVNIFLSKHIESNEIVIEKKFLKVLYKIFTDLKILQSKGVIELDTLLNLYKNLQDILEYFNFNSNELTRLDIKDDDIIVIVLPNNYDTCRCSNNILHTVNTN